MELPIYKLTIDEESEGVDFVALTDRPAIERNFQAFSNQIRFTETAKRVLSGPLMLADTPVYRNDPKLGEYMVVFDKDTIYKIAQKFFKMGAQKSVNIEHNKPVDGLYLFESFIIDRERGVNPPKGYEDVTDGSWFGSYKVENDAIWAARDNFKGFSVEGMFGMERMETAVEAEFAMLEKAVKNFLQTISPLNISK
jgi:hypothetical protein